MIMITLYDRILIIIKTTINDNADYAISFAINDDPITINDDDTAAAHHLLALIAINHHHHQ